MIVNKIWLWIGFLLVLLIPSPLVATPLEDKLETEIDPREPRSFTNRRYKTLAIRQDTFKYMEQVHNDGSKTSFNIGNWEIFAARYWYETRVINTTCPQLPRGIAAEADWALMVPCLFGNMSKPPRTIFVHTYMLPHFVESTLHFMDPSYRFVLITAGTDATVPRSLDGRFKIMRGFSMGLDGGAYYQMILKSPQIIHWYAENHDLGHPKISTLPTAMSVDKPDDHSDYPQNRSGIIPIQNRVLKVLVSDRVRSGTGTWALRAEVARMCSNSTLCITPSADKKGADSGVSHKDFVNIVLTVPFVACVRGGGLDPSPKAWESIMLGAIPIIQHNSLDDAYEKLPVVFIKDWKEIFKSPDAEAFLRKHLEKLAPYFEEGSELRKKTLEKLTTEFWVEQIARKIRDYDSNQTANAGHHHTHHNGSRAQTTSTRLRRISEETPVFVVPQPVVETVRNDIQPTASLFSRFMQFFGW